MCAALCTACTCDTECLVGGYMSGMYNAACNPSAACEEAASRERHLAHRTLQRSPLHYMQQLRVLALVCCCCEATLRGPSCTDRSWVRSRKPSSQTHRARHTSRRMLRLSTTLHLQNPKPAHSFHIPKWGAQSLRACSLTLRALKRPRRCHAADKSATPKLRPRL
jgi:hypothetical protein